MKHAWLLVGRGRTVAELTAVAYALFNDRILFDIFPAFVGPTFINPIPYLPFYWLAWNARSMLIGALVGAVYAPVGLGFVLGEHALQSPAGARSAAC